MGSGIAMRDPAHVTPQVNLCMHTMFCMSVASRDCMAKVPFLFCFFGGPDMDTEMGVVIYMYVLKTFPRLY